MNETEIESGVTVAAQFDFESYRSSAEEQFRRIRPDYADLAKSVEDILHSSLHAAGIEVTSIQSRAKEIESFGRKAALPLPTNSEAPKYTDPIAQITDLAAARAIVYFLSSVQAADEVINDQFDVLEKVDKSAHLDSEAELGYRSVHYIVQLNDARLELPEYARFRSLRAEVQVRTILQHAWAEIEHDIQYKSVDELPSEIRRRFLALAGMLEIGDREFQAIANAHERLKQRAEQSVNDGDLEAVELTPDSLKLFLDREFGPDARMSKDSYGWSTRLLKRLGFGNLQQLKAAIDGWDDDRLSRIVWGNRQGQLTRLEDVLRASMGERFLSEHPWNLPEYTWFTDGENARFQRLREHGVDLGDFDPGKL